MLCRKHCAGLHSLTSTGCTTECAKSVPVTSRDRLGLAYRVRLKWGSHAPIPEDVHLHRKKIKWSQANVTHMYWVCSQEVRQREVKGRSRPLVMKLQPSLIFHSESCCNENTVKLKGQGESQIMCMYILWAHLYASLFSQGQALPPRPETQNSYLHA